MARNTPIDDLEQIVELAHPNLTDGVNTLLDWYGNRPFLEKRLNDREQLEAYQALRNAPDGMYHYADGIREQLDARLADYSEEERIALGLGQDEIRRISYYLTLKYDQRMKNISKKLGIPIEGLEPVPPPLPPVVEPMLGGEPWLESEIPLEASLDPSIHSGMMMSPAMIPLPQPPPLPPLPASIH